MWLWDHFFQILDNGGGSVLLHILEVPTVPALMTLLGGLHPIHLHLLGTIHVPDPKLFFHPDHGILLSISSIDKACGLPEPTLRAQPTCVSGTTGFKEQT